MAGARLQRYMPFWRTTMKYDFDLQKMIESKQAYRKKLAALPMGEKFRMLNAMRAREVEIRKNPNHPCKKKISKEIKS